MSVRELARDHGFIFNKGAKWLIGDPDSSDVIETYPNKDAAIEDLVVNRNPKIHAALGALLKDKIASDTTGRYASAVTKEELDMIEGDDLVPAGRAFDVEEAE
jgi:hypothetical protein